MPHARHASLALLALALGGFTIGTTEFVTMGLLPQVADSIGESIPTTGHMISAYALGVVVGAPTIVALAARLPKRGLAIALVLALAVGNALTALAHGYLPVLAARFVAGLPHGAYFGVASLLAASMVAPELKGRAVSSVMMGLSVATVAGVPASAAIGQHLGWRASYWTVVALALLAAAMIRLFVPALPGDASATVRGELSALRRPQVLFAAAAGMVGFGGLFAVYSYIAPITTDVAGFSRGAIPWVLFGYGLGSVVGTWAAGIGADWNNTRQIFIGFVGTIALLLGWYAAAGLPAATVIGAFVLGGIGSPVAIGLQLRLMEVAGDAQMVGAALNHSSLNLANGLGAWLGGLVIAAGHGYLSPALVGAGLASAGLLVYAVGIGVQSRSAGSDADRPGVIAPADPEVLAPACE